MMIVIHRVINKIGGTHYVGVPPEWLRENKLESGDEVTVISHGDIVIVTANDNKVAKLINAIQKLAD